jgi:hypothetical protein
MMPRLTLVWIILFSAAVGSIPAIIATLLLR